jgi:hypothetical protein
MQKQVVCALFLLFLIGTCEMQTVSTATSISLSKLDSEPPVSLSTLKAASAFAKGAFTALKTKFDTHGHLEKLIQFMTGPALWKKTLGEQQLLQEVAADLYSQGDKFLFIATCVLLLGSILKAAPWETLAGKIKSETFQKHKGKIQAAGNVFITLVMLIAAMLFFHAFMCTADYFLDNDITDIRVIGPLLLKLTAAAFFTLQPMTALMSLSASSKGLQWPAVIGMTLFHLGNLVSAFYALQGLVVGNGLSYYGDKMRAISLMIFVLATGLILAFNAREEIGLSNKYIQNGYNLGGHALLVAAAAISFFKSV